MAYTKQVTISWAGPLTPGPLTKVFISENMAFLDSIVEAGLAEEVPIFISPRIGCRKFVTAAAAQAWVDFHESQTIKYNIETEVTRTISDVTE